MYFYDNILLNFRRIINVQTRAAEKIKTHILCPIIFFSRKSRSLWDNLEKHTKHCCFFAATKVWQARHTVTLYVHFFFFGGSLMCFPGRLLRYFLSNFEIVPVATIITGTTFVFRIQMHCISIGGPLMVAQWLRYCGYKSEGRWYDSRWCHLHFSLI
jgi:hypothetical protein